MGSADRIIRLIVAAIIAVLFLSGSITGTLGIVLAIIALIFIATSIFGFCPLYTLLGIRTCKTSNNK